MSAPSLLISLVYYNDFNRHGAELLQKNLESILQQKGFVLNKNLNIFAVDNASADGTAEFIEKELKRIQVDLDCQEVNLGFCGANNLAVEKFLAGDFSHLLFLNTDMILAEDTLLKMTEAFDVDPQIGIATPRSYRLNPDLSCSKTFLDAAGMKLTSSLRHFDRGSNEIAAQQYTHSEFVFGASGCCMMLSRAAVNSLLLSRHEYSSDYLKIYPQLNRLEDCSVELFDNAFFAYREDADLSWRAQRKGWKCYYVADAEIWHKRYVLSDNRQSVASEINSASVRNRFLLQLNNLKVSDLIWAWPGFLIRNILVVIAVLIKERTSAKALLEFCILFKRGLENRKFIHAQRVKQ